MFKVIDRETRGVIPNYRNSYNLFFFASAVSILFSSSPFSSYANTLSSTESMSVNGSRTIVSVGDAFELGFFNPAASLPNSDRWYLGIWYKKISERTYVWVANRDNPLSNSAGTLKISGINLVLLNQSDIPVWSTNLTGAVRSPVIAELLSNGNFVLRDSKTKGEDGFLWQSFDYPTNILLPEMKLGLDLKTGRNRYLTSWKNSYDPSRGSFWFKLENLGLPDFFMGNLDTELFRSGPWDGIGFSSIPDMLRWNNVNIVYHLSENEEEIVYTYRVTRPDIYSRWTLTSLGVVELSTWNPTMLAWELFSSISPGYCDSYWNCNPNSYCDMNLSQMCKCIKGFEQQEWSTNLGVFQCVRKTPFSCTGDGFYRLRNMKLPDTREAIVDKKIGLKECEERCLKDCNCTVFANTDIRDGGSGCVIWRDVELLDVRTYANGGQDLYVKLAPTDLVTENANNNSGKTKMIIGLSVGATVLVFLGFIIFWWGKRKKAAALEAPFEYAERRHNLLADEAAEDLELPLMEYDIVAMATNGFCDSNKLGEGGFGPVYKGRLLDGEEIAVKRLSMVSTQGTTEFATEMKLIAKLQHINLVRLLGCYADTDEKILVYEYLENLSLDYYLFDKTRSYQLHWQKRLDIINGVARGLLYLHQDSRCRIIHRDLKTSNILLDKDMIPKISDFGMARIFARDEEEATTRRIVGTYGYMAPEYAMDGIYSEKSDVFSFGIVLLEIISGRKNRGFSDSDQDKNLLGFVWRNMEEETWHDIVDPTIIDSCRPDEFLRCIKIGLTCVQDHPALRPTMSWVVLMLGSESEISKPGPPLTYMGISYGDTESSSTIEYTISQITAR